MSRSTLPGWPPYMVAALTYPGVIVASGVAVLAYLVVAEWRPGMSFEALVQQGAGGGAAVLLLSAGTTSVMLGGLSLVLAARGGTLALRRGALIARRMALRGVSPKDMVAAAVGVLGLALLLDSFLMLVGLGDEGSLAAFRDSLASLDGTERVLAAAAIGALPGVGEELFFRGYFMRRIEVVDGTRIALVVSSIVFGVFHSDLVHTPTAALMGVYLGLMVLWSGSLWTGIFAHTVNNTTAAIFASNDRPGELELVAYMFGGLALAAVMLWYVWRRHRGPELEPYW